jgi:hypothetical protein
MAENEVTSEEKDPVLDRLNAWKEESKNIRASKDARNAYNLKLFKGLWRDEDNPKSKIRGKNKTFFRKIWATIWRLTATMYQAFLKDNETFRIIGRDLDNDPRKARVLQKMCEYRRDKMNSEGSLFLKFIWAIQNIFNYGFTCGKLVWNYDEAIGQDGPEFVLYPFEQVFPDLVAETKEKMRYIHFLNYLTKEEMNGLDYDTKGMQASAPESNQLRSVRYQGDADPQMYADVPTSYSSPFGGHYPTPGSTPDSQKDEEITRYRVYESFWREDGKIMYAVSLDFRHWLKEPKESAYGKRYPIVMGQCLTEMHKLIGEGFPEPLEAPQESFNYNLNMRKDNLATSMTGHTFVSRYGGVDLNSLTNRRTSGITLMDDVNAVKHEQMPDVTRNAYIEAGSDEAMMDEMSGITPGLRGMERTDKATVAQINYQESNAKIDLYVALVGETFFRDFYRELARQIQMFETDEIVYRIANDNLNEEEETYGAETIYDVEDIDMDCMINVGPGTVGQNVHVQQTLLAMDRAIMTLQAVPALAQMGAIPPEGLKVPNVSKFFEKLLPNIGHRDLKEFFITIPPVQPQEGGVGSPPNIGGGTPATNAEMIQRGSAGGV